MDIKNRVISNYTDVYEYMEGLVFPYRYRISFDLWEKSYCSDVDGKGRTLFSDLTTVGAYLNGSLTGFIQYGRSAFGFDDNGEISDTVSYPIIRNFYFPPEQENTGCQLLDMAVKALSGSDNRIYAFFHYFGMSCYARHGKLFDKFGHIHDLLLKKGFSVEHENVFYSSELSGYESSPVMLRWQERSAGRERYCDFAIGNDVVGGCEVHFLEQEDIAYLRWIYVNKELCGKGISSKCMSALKNDLYQMGKKRFDTDTALTNTAAQHFYDKNGFTKEGFTRSYERSAR